MKITIINGFFLPIPPKAGGAVEKTWDQLARIFAASGHDVTYVSRRWPGLPETGTDGGVKHKRLRGYNHRARLWQNLALDFLWSRRVTAALEPADIAVVQSVTLPIWLGRQRPDAGRVVVMPGRMPKGQYRFYRRIARVMATSTPVQERVLAENPALGPVTHVTGYPIDWPLFAQPRPPADPSLLTIGFIGRIHREKGLDLLVEALGRLAADRGIPRWRLVLCGPTAISAGGSGGGYAAGLRQRLSRYLPAEAWQMREPVFDPEALARLYREIDIFCYPSVAGGETFGVAAAEAMAAGAATIVSGLSCFRDFVVPKVTGEIFDHTGPDAIGELAQALRNLLIEPGRRRQLGASAQAAMRRYDFPVYAENLLRDFATLPPSLASASR